MIVTSQGISEIRGYENSLDTEEYSVRWIGLPFIPGILSGAPSIRFILNKIKENGLPKTIPELMGNFFMVITHKTSATTYGFIDNSGFRVQVSSCKILI